MGSLRELWAVIALPSAAGVLGGWARSCALLERACLLVIEGQSAGRGLDISSAVPTQRDRVMKARSEIASRSTRLRRGGALRTAVVRAAALLGAAPLLLLTAAPSHAVVGAPSEDAEYGFTARLLIGDHERGCSGTLISSEWLLTAASCFADDPAADLTVPAGAPRLKTVATVGGDQVRDVVELLPHGERDLVLARLAQPVRGVEPVTVATSAPAEGQELTVAGHGRTAQEWAPLEKHTGTFAVSAVNGGDLVMSGRDGASVCQGDAGGPAFRTVDGRPALVAVSSRSNQVGCFGVDTAEGTSSSAVSTRVDDVREWIAGNAVRTPVSDYDGDGRSDVGVLYDNGRQSDGSQRTGLWSFTSTGSGFGEPQREWDSKTFGNWDWSRSKTVSGDFNGDGRGDVGVLYDNGRQSDGFNRTTLWTFSGTASGFGQPVKVWDNAGSGGPSWDWSRSKVTSGDFDGDGRGDVGVLYDNGQLSDGANRSALWTFTSTGSGFGGPVRVWDSAGSFSWSWERSKVTSGDFDGDGRGDVGVLYDNGQLSDGANRSALWTFTSTGSGFGGPVRVWDSAGSFSWSWERSKVTSGDFDGDGRGDVGVLYDNGQLSDGANRSALWTFTSTGSGFGGPVRVWDSAGSFSWSWERSKVTSGDFDGDGRGDVGVLYDNGQLSDGANRSALWTFTSTGSGFGGPVRVWDSAGSFSWSWERSKVTSGDFDGDGRGDVGVLYDNGQLSDGANRSALWTFTSTGSGFGGPVRVWDSAGSFSWSWERSKVTSGDFDGDGRGDVGVLYDNGQLSDGANRSALWTFTSTGSGFGGPVRVWDSAGSFSWSWERSKVTSGDFDGDGRGDVGVLYDNGQLSDGANRSALWTLTSTGSGFGGPVRVWDSAGSFSWSWERSKVTSGDFAGDGRGDVGGLYDNGQLSDGANRSALWTLTSTGSGFGGPVRVWDSAGSFSWSWERSKVTSGDFAGDGRGDVGGLYDNGQLSDGANRSALWTLTSTGSGFGGPVRVWDSAGSFSWSWERSKVTSGDFAGDGRGDVGGLYDNGQLSDGANRSALWTLTSTGSGFGGPVRVWDSAGSFSWSWERSKVTSGDFAGDGRGDVGGLYDNGQLSDGANRSALWTLTSTGSGFGGPVRVWDSAGSFSWSWERSKVTSGDFAGDGRGDVGGLYDNGQLSDGANRSALWTLTSTGSGFGGPVRVWDSAGSFSWSWERSKVTSGDFDGDGRGDVGVLYDNGQLSDGANRSALWTLTSTGSGFGGPVRVWDSAGSISWSWARSELT